MNSEEKASNLLSIKYPYNLKSSKLAVKSNKALTLNTVVRVTNLDNDKSIILRINDRGPYVDGRILDCSFGAAKKLGFHEQGTANVEIKIIEEGDGEYMHH